MVRLEMTEGGSDKFWEAEQVGAVLHIRFGKRGTDGQRQEKPFADEAAASAALAKLVAEKTKKGYAPVGEVASAAPPSAPSAAPPSKPKAKKAAGLKTFSGDSLRLIALSPTGSFVVSTGVQIKHGDSFSQTLTIKRPDAEITVPVHGMVQGLAVLPDERIVASIQEGWPFAQRYAEAGLVMVDPQGVELGRIMGEAYAGAGQILLDATGTSLAFVAKPGAVGHPRYLKSTVFFGRVTDLFAGTAPHARDFAEATPSFAFDDAGVLVIEARGKRESFDVATGAPHASPGRVALKGHHDAVTVLEGERVLFELPANVCEHAVLLDGGRLLTLATAVQKRMGLAGEASVQWPDAEPLLRADHLALWDVIERRLVRALPRSAGRIASVSVAPGALIAVLTHANKGKVELFDWASVVG